MSTSKNTHLDTWQVNKVKNRIKTVILATTEVLFESERVGVNFLKFIIFKYMKEKLSYMYNKKNTII